MAAALAAVLLLAACGDDDAGVDATPLTSAPSDAGTTPDAGTGVGDGDGGDVADAGDATDTAVVVTVDGVEYPVTLVQDCETERDEARSTDLKAFGFAESGERIELAFSYQVAEESPSGTEQYYGRVSIASGELSAQTVVDEPFEFLTDDRSRVVGSLPMEVQSDGRTVEVSFDVTCPGA